jgi:hypothetical protein
MAGWLEAQTRSWGAAKADCGICAHDQGSGERDRVLDWPPERQADVAEVVTLMEAQDKSTLRLTDEQAAEVRRRLADPLVKTIPAEEVFRRFRSPGT